MSPDTAAAHGSAAPRGGTLPSSQQQDREHLALAFRLAERFGFHEGICNHFSVRLDGGAEHYLINPFGLHWSEIGADSLLLIDGDGTVLEGDGEVEDTARFIHVAGHRANARHKALLHTHMPYATALTLLQPPASRLAMAHQTATRFHERIDYVDTYGGLAHSQEEGDRLAAHRSSAVDITFLAHHGVVVGGQSVAMAFDDLYYLERACRQQLLAMQTGAALNHLSEAVVESTYRQFSADCHTFAEQHFQALGRVLDNHPGWVPVF